MALPDLKKYFHVAQMRPAICGCVSDYEAKLKLLQQYVEAMEINFHWTWR